MSITYVMGLLGGLALFLYGMQMMSTGLEAAAGNRMKTILEKLTANRITDRGILFSDHANGELVKMRQTCGRLFGLLLEKPADYVAWHEKVACMEQKIDDMTARFRDNMYARMQSGTCSHEGSILFSEMLTDFERIGDHALNIANEMLKMAMIEK